jgi:hypothetical protein
MDDILGADLSDDYSNGFVFSIDQKSTSMGKIWGINMCWLVGILAILMNLRI